MKTKITPKAVLIPTLSLFLICIFVTAALAYTNSVTADKIAANEAQSKQESMKSVCPEAQTFDEIIPDTLYEGKNEAGETVGYAISTSAQGYGGQVKVMTGIYNDEIIGVDVFYNDEETPGLGKNTSKDSFTDQYKGLDVFEDIVVSKDATPENNQTVDAVTSATISSRAVTTAVNEAIAIYKDKVGTKSGGIDALRGNVEISPDADKEKMDSAVSELLKDDAGSVVVAGENGTESQKKEGE